LHGTDAIGFGVFDAFGSRIAGPEGNEAEQKQEGVLHGKMVGWLQEKCSDRIGRGVLIQLIRSFVFIIIISEYFPITLNNVSVVKTMKDKTNLT